MSTFQPDLDAVIFEFTCDCELPPFPGRTLPRFCPTAELLDLWTRKHPRFKRELIDYATSMFLMDMDQEVTPEVELSEAELDAFVERSMAIVRPMIDEAFEGRVTDGSQGSTPEGPSDS